MGEVAWVGFRADTERSERAKFCRERGIRVWQFYEWKKRLVEAEAGSFVSVELKPAERPTHSSSGEGD